MELVVVDGGGGGCIRRGLINSSSIILHSISRFSLYKFNFARFRVEEKFDSLY